MKTLPAIVILLAAFLAQAEDSWKIVDEGFQLNLPVSWQKQKVQCIDSHCGAYKGSTADLHFDGVVGLGYTVERAQSEINELKKKEADPKLLSSGEEVWYVDGRIASFSIGELDPRVYGTRRFSNVAALRVPDDTGRGSYLSIYIIYESDKDVPTVRRVLRSLEFKRKDPTPGTKTTHNGLAVELPPDLTPGHDPTSQRRNGQLVEWPNPNTIVLPEESMVFRRISPSLYGAALPDFFLLETEVTNDMYHRYLKLSGSSPKNDAVSEDAVNGNVKRLAWRKKKVQLSAYDSGNWDLFWVNSMPPNGLGDNPVGLVTIADAQDFCRWLSSQYPDVGNFRLPTIQEWIVAAYGGADRSYPWGNEWNLEVPCVSRSKEKQRTSTEAVRRHDRDVTPEGIFGLWGNVAEYVSDKDSFPQDSRWMGGSFKRYPEKADYPFPYIPRNDWWGYLHGSRSKKEDVGFRVLLEAKEELKGNPEATWDEILRAMKLGDVDELQRHTTPQGFHSLTRAVRDQSNEEAFRSLANSWSKWTVRWVKRTDARAFGVMGPEVKEHGLEFIRTPKGWRLNEWSPGY